MTKHSHSHGPSPRMTPEATESLRRGLTELVKMTEGLAFKPLPFPRYPLPLTTAVFGETPAPDEVRRQVETLMAADPINALDPALVLLELYECNQSDVHKSIFDDKSFLGQVFGTKRMNGWTAILGDGDTEKTMAMINEKWQFKLLPCRERKTAVYPLLNSLVRYGFVYGRMEPGDAHSMSHFLEEFGPGVLILDGHLSDLELALSLATMKMGIPAVVPTNYPFPLGRQARVGSAKEITHMITVFPNMRKLISTPDLVSLPDYLDWNNTRDQFEPAQSWGNTGESFYVLRKGKIRKAGVQVTGSPSESSPMGVIVTVDAEPMDAFDRLHIEWCAPEALAMMKGVKPKVDGGRLVLNLADGVRPDPERIGEVLIASIRRDFPKIEKVGVEILFDNEKISAMAGSIRREIAERQAEIDSATEESVSEFVSCTGCSPFAPDHACIVTPQRPPQCGRSFMGNRAGARYGYDDMSNIHHRVLHAGINSFQVFPKGECLDAEAGEWSGANEAAARLTGGRTTRVKLHSMDEFPHTGCGCFSIIMFKTSQPRDGIGIMDRGYPGKAPDGRTWSDLYYAQAGKQTPDQASASPGYLTSPKFLAGNGGWPRVVWVSPGIAKSMGDKLPSGIPVGDK